MQPAFNVRARLGCKAALCRYNHHSALHVRGFYDTPVLKLVPLLGELSVHAEHVGVALISACQLHDEVT